MQRNLKGSLMLLTAALIWGTAFVAQSEGMRYVEPFTYNALRTLLGGIVLIPIILLFRFFGRKGNSGEQTKERASLRTTVIGGIVCGVILFAASSLQQCGIAMTTAGKAGFITALYIIIVPLLQFILTRKTQVKTWVCVVVAAIGFYLLCMSDGLTLNRGDGLMLCCAFVFAMHIMAVDYFCARETDGMLMACIQFLTAGLLMTVCMLLWESPDVNAILDAKYTILYAGIMSSGVAYTLQILGQRHTEPTIATLLMSLESVFAALSGWLILRESMLPKELLGCTLVFIAVIFAQISPLTILKKMERKQHEEVLK